MSERLGTIGVCDLRKGGDGGKKGGGERACDHFFVTLLCPFLSHLDLAIKVSKFPPAGMILIFPVQESHAT